MNLAYVDSGSGSMLITLVSLASTALMIAAVVGLTLWVSRRRRADRQQPPA